MNNSYLAQITVLLSAGWVLQAAGSDTVQIPAQSEILTGLRKAHPRLLASAQDFERLKQQVASNDQLKLWHSIGDG